MRTARCPGTRSARCVPGVRRRARGQGSRYRPRLGRPHARRLTRARRLPGPGDCARSSRRNRPARSRRHSPADRPPPRSRPPAVPPAAVEGPCGPEVCHAQGRVERTLLYVHGDPRLGGTPYDALPSARELARTTGYLVRLPGVRGPCPHGRESQWTCGCEDVSAQGRAGCPRRRPFYAATARYIRPRCRSTAPAEAGPCADVPLSPASLTRLTPDQDPFRRAPRTRRRQADPPGGHAGWP